MANWPKRLNRAGFPPLGIATVFIRCTMGPLSPMLVRPLRWGRKWRLTQSPAAGSGLVQRLTRNPVDVMKIAADNRKPMECASRMIVTP